jgi:hypothetical protein
MQKDPKETESNDISLESITKQCKDAPGYVVFLATIERGKETNAKPVLHFNYRRYQFSFEDTRAAIQAFKDFFREELRKMEDGLMAEDIT